MKRIVPVAVLLAACFCAAGLALHRACEGAPANKLGWVDVAGYDSECLLAWHTNVGSIFSVSHRHPLMTVVLSPITAVGSSVAQRLGEEAGKRAVIGVFALVGAASFLLLWLVMRGRGRDAVPCACAAVLWLSFAHVWILGGIAESFPVSLAISLGALLMVERDVRDGRAWAALSSFAGAVTVTNVVKPMLAWWAGGGDDPRRGRTTLAFGAALAACVLLGGACLAVKWCLIDGCGLAAGAASVRGDVTACLPAGMDWGRRLWFLWNGFWCEPMMLHGTVIGKGPVEAAYPTLLPHAVGAGVLALCAVSVVRNRREPVVRAALAMFSVDFVLHVVLGWGIAEGQIYCGHWFYLIPVLVSRLPRRLALLALPLAALVLVRNLSVVFGW